MHIICFLSMPICLVRIENVVNMIYFFLHYKSSGLRYYKMLVISRIYMYYVYELNFELYLIFSFVSHLNIMKYFLNTLKLVYLFLNI